MAQLNWRNSAIALKHAAQPWVYGRRGPLSLLTLKLWIPGSVRSPAIGVPSRSVYLPWTVKYVVPDGLWAPLPLAHYSTKWLVRLLREKSGHASKNRVGRLRSRVVRSARPSGSNDSGLECARSIRSMLHPASGIDETAEFASARRGPRADELTLTPLELINRIAPSAASRYLPAPGLLIRKPAPSAAGASPPALPAELAATIANLPTEMNCENRINKVFTIWAASIEMQFQITVKGIS